MSFIQFFGSALQVTPHFHSLVPDGVFVPREGGVRFEALPPPTVLVPVFACAAALTWIIATSFSR
ncbi:transposase [Archangium sp.]|uniref:transposase n=1 Tax=Archangium sp. TaxID=1872627 RepID=UPI002D541BCB|nr:transposase [Archangium sp.]HYO59475.1 transposase [Archangium sp.]